MPGSERPLRQGQGLAASSLRGPGLPAETRTPVPDSPHQTESPCLRLTPCPPSAGRSAASLHVHPARMQTSIIIMIIIFCSFLGIIISYGGDDGDPHAARARRRAAHAQPHTAP